MRPTPKLPLLLAALLSSGCAVTAPDEFAPKKVERPQESAAPPARAPAPADTRAAGSGRVFVLAVGVNDYQSTALSHLRFAESDARLVYRFFATSRRSPTTEDRVTILLGAQATRAGVLRALRENLLDRATPSDTVVLYFAGHGFADNSDTYLATVDTRLDALPETAIGFSTLQSYWERTQAASRVFLVDACHSGGLAGLRGIGGVVSAPSSTPTESGAAGGTITIASAGANELSAEDERLGQGIFTSVLVQALEGDADADRDGVVVLDEVADYITHEVPRQARALGARQTPVVRYDRSAGGLALSR
jgi:uncharacterized caspase-like protein